jgi:uncharacterized membrane protein YraQ (UPF0718 family)
MIGFLQEILWHVISKIHYYFEGSYTEKVANTASGLFGQLWYFFFLGIVFTALISVIWPKEKLAAFLSRSRDISILSAVVVGVLSPVPTYVAIPLVAALYRIGVPGPPLFAFLMSSPLMNPILFSLTTGAFGLEMAAARLSSAVILGTCAGYAFWIYDKRKAAMFVRASFDPINISGEAQTQKRFLSNLRLFGLNFYKLTKFAGKYFLLGLSIAAAVKALLPADLVIRTVGSQYTISVLVAVAAGIPLYACGGGTIPVMQTLMDLGLSKGAVLAFFISGPATKISTLVALKATVTGGVFLIYLLIALLGATFFGIIYGFI